MASYGNTSASSLIKSSNSIRNAIENYNDTIAEQEWQMSAKTDADYQRYSNYVSKKMEDLSKRPNTISNASKFASLSSKQQTVYSSYVSHSISAMSTKILEGNATNIDKLNAIGSFWNQAKNIGNEDLAASLYNDYLQLDQKIQYDAQVAEAKYTEEASKVAAAQANGYDSAISMFNGVLEDISTIVKRGGQQVLLGNLVTKIQSINESIRQANQANENAIASGITEPLRELPIDATPNIGALAQGLIEQISIAQDAQAKIWSVVEGHSSDVQKYQQAAKDTLSTDKFKIGSENMSYMEASYWASNFDAYGYAPATGENAYTTVQATDAEGNGLFDDNGNAIFTQIPATQMIERPREFAYYDEATGALKYAYNPTDFVASWATGDDKEKRKKDLERELSSLGFEFSDYAKISDDGSITVKLSDNENNKFVQEAFEKSGISGQTYARVYVTPQGYQIQPTTLEGKNASSLLFEINKSSGGLYGVYKTTYDKFSKGTKREFISGQPGYATPQQNDQLVKNLTTTAIPKFTPLATGPVKFNTKEQQLEYWANTLHRGVPSLPGLPDNLTKTSTASQQSNGVYWLGRDGNIWYKNDSGTINAGNATFMNDTGFKVGSKFTNAKRIDDPVNPTLPKTQNLSLPKLPTLPTLPNFKI